MKFRKRKKIHKMTLEQVIETVALLGKHLRTYTPLLAAIGSTKGKIRRELIARTFTRLSDDENALHDVQKIVSNLTGINAGTEFSLKDFAKLPESWLAND